MRSVSFFHKETGLLHPVTVIASDDEAIKLNTPPDHEPIDNPKDGSVHDHMSRRVNMDVHARIKALRNELNQKSLTPTEGTAEQISAVQQAEKDWRSQREADIEALQGQLIVDYQPPQPSVDHEWNGTTKRWQLNAATRERESKRRDAQQRIAALAHEERHLLRRLALNSFDAEAKERLTAIDTEIAELRLTAL